MSNITMISGLGVRKNGLSVAPETESVFVAMIGDRLIRNVQTIGTSHEAIETGDVATAGFARFKNLDTENFVEVGIEVAAAFEPVIKLMPGETAGPFRLSHLDMFAKADTAPVNLDIFITET